MSALTKITSIKRPSLHDELTERLRNMIVEGVLVSGEKVPERELCEKLGVSRTPMREALKVLAAENLISLEPNRGARVRTLTVEDLEEVFPVLGALEVLTGELACKNITDAQMTELKKAHNKMIKHFRQADMPEYFRCNQRIHEIIMDAAANPTLSTAYQSLAVRVRRARYLANNNNERWQQAVDEHEEIMAALDSRDGQLLGSILKRHLMNKFKSVRQWLHEQASTDPNPNSNS